MSEDVSSALGTRLWIKVRLAHCSRAGEAYGAVEDVPARAGATYRLRPGRGASLSGPAETVPRGDRLRRAWITQGLIECQRISYSAATVSHEFRAAERLKGQYERSAGRGRSIDVRATRAATMTSGGHATQR